MSWLRISPVVRISLGLVGLTISVVLLADFLLGFSTAEQEVVMAERKKLVETLAIEYSTLAQNDSYPIIQRLVRSLVERNDDVLSAALRHLDGEFLAVAGDHDRHWDPRADGRSDLTNTQVPIFKDGSRWGTVELAFKSEGRRGLLRTILIHPTFAFVAVIFVVSFFLYLWFMQRVLKHLDPTAVVPERVKLAFNTLSEGVLVLDDRHNVLLANTAFADRVDCTPDSLVGKNLNNVNWDLNDSVGGDLQPWERAIKEDTSVLGKGMTLTTEQNLVRKFMVNSAVIHDANGKVRGTLTTFDDVTALEAVNLHLLETMKELEDSRTQIEIQNEELKRLASRDPMTGCLNRRAFFETFERLFVEAQRDGLELSCIMSDIDHFKSFNDTYGHAVGDQVIQVVASTLEAHLRSNDLLCRYGGEEFCIVFPGLDRGATLNIAERIRGKIEEQAGRALRTTSGITVTSSFGVASLSGGATDPVELIDQADQALYASKEGGRNRVSTWPFDSADVDTPVTLKSLEAAG